MVDSIFNASQESFSHLTNSPNLAIKPSLSASSSSSKISIVKNHRKPKSQQQQPHRSRIDSLSSNTSQNFIGHRLIANNVSFDVSTNNGANNFNKDQNADREFDINDSYCDSETTSGVVTNTNNTVSPDSSDANVVDFTLKNSTNEFLKYSLKYNFINYT
jgi:hypothetical protein